MTIAERVRILNAFFAALGVEKNDIHSFLRAKRWLGTHKGLLNRLGVRFSTAGNILELYCFDFDTIDQAIEDYLGLSDLPF